LKKKTVARKSATTVLKGNQLETNVALILTKKKLKAADDAIARKLPESQKSRESTLNFRPMRWKRKPWEQMQTSARMGKPTG